MPDIAFDQTGWDLGNNATLDDGVVTIEGGNGYRVARYRLDPKIVRTHRFYFTVDVRLHGIKPGPELFARPKVKVFNPGAPRPSVRKLQADECEQWTPVTVPHQLLKGGKLPPWIKLEVSMQNCGGRAEFRNPRISFEHPPVETDYPFERPGDATATLALSTDNPRPFPNRLLGVNQQWTWSPVGYEHPTVQAFVREVKPPSLRFPAGTVANYYDWRTDGFAWPAPGEGPQWLDYVIGNDKRFEYEHYLKLCKELELSSPLTFNVLGDSAVDSAARLRDRLDRGLDVQHIELGNENYFEGQRGGRVHEVSDYIAVTRELVDALREVDARIPLAVNVTHHDGVGEMAAWNQALAVEDYYDAVVLHPYLGLGSARPDTDGIRRMLSLGRHLERRIAECHEEFGKPIVLSEWGILAPGKGSESVAAAIGIADGWLTLIDQWEAGRVRSAGIHMLCYGDGAQGSGLYGLNREDMTIHTSRRGAVYELALQAFGDAQLLAGRAESATLTDGLPGVTARAARHADGTITLFAVNKFDVAAPLNVTLDDQPVTAAALASYVEPSLSEGVLHWPLGEQPLQRRRVEGQIELPPLSVNLITIPTIR